ncbi:MAG: hypothetical protein QOG72_1057 [Sphingomonadales bacterium]|jgi:hypothetical protein|nr:hypothetical protein [Sphingomonadales bacterium]
MRLILCVLAAMSGAAALAQAPLRSTSQNPLYPAQTLAIAGVKLGMTPPEVDAAARSTGYTRSRQDRGENWDARIARLVAMNRSIRIPGSGEIIRREEYKKGEEELQVEYNATPRGAAVATVRYELGNDAITASRFREAALARYGAPTRPSEMQMMYCSAGEIACTPVDFPTATQEPNIIVDIPLRAITLSLGARLWREHSAMERAEMNRRAPKVQRPTF